MKGSVRNARDDVEVGSMQRQQRLTCKDKWFRVHHLKKEREKDRKGEKLILLHIGSNV